MTTIFTTNRNYPKPDFDTRTWHDQMHQSLDMIDADVMAFYRNPGWVVEAWDHGVGYVLNDKVLDTDKLQMFICNVAHTSVAGTVSFESDRIANPTYWTAFGVPLVPRGQWYQSTSYSTMDHVYDTVEAIYAICTLAHVSTSSGNIRTDASKWMFVADIGSVTNAAVNAAAAAAASATAAHTSELNAANSASTASLSAANASASANTANTASGTATTKAAEASASAASALSSKNSAATSETNAANSAAAAAVSAGSMSPYNVNPAMDGAAAPGVNASYSRGDHVHPSDTSRVNKAGDTMTGPLILPGGAVGATSLHFGTAGTGVWGGATNVTVSVGGAIGLSISNASVSARFPVVAPDGVVGTPAYSWNNELTSGFYRAGASDIRFSISGADKFNFGSAAHTSAVPINVPVTPLASAHAASKQYVDAGDARAVGSLVQSVSGFYTANADITASIPLDDTIPQVGEGTQIISVTITPQSVTNKLRARFTGNVSLTQNVDSVVAIFSTNPGANAVGAIDTRSGTTAGGGRNILAIESEWTPGSVSTQTVQVRVGTDGTFRMNGTINGRFFGGASAATLVVEEIKA